MCDASSAEKAKAAQLDDFSKNLVGQANDIMGNDSTVFNNMLKSYQSIVAGGPSQHGFTAAEKSDLTSAAITNNANQFRNVSGAVKAGQAAYGGGNTVSTSGTTVAQNQGVAQAAAANTANQLNQIDQADYETGRDNYFKAAAGETQIPGVFNNLASVDAQAREGLGDSLQEQKSLDAASGWWKAPVMGLVGSGLNMATGGLSGFATKALNGGDKASNPGGATNNANELAGMYS